MAFILTSILPTHYYDEDGVKQPSAITDDNGFLSAINRYVKKLDRLVYVANYPHDPAGNDEGIAPAFRGFEMSGLDFKQKIILDDRNKADAAELISGADLVVLGGGKIECELRFLKDIGFRRLMRNYTGLVIGTSAGAMNLCRRIANFPEDVSDFGQKLWLRGLGFCKRIVIPHFDGETCTYQLPTGDLNVVNEFILPFSYEHELTGIPNGSYILIDGRDETLCGDIYSIKDSRVTKIN